MKFGSNLFQSQEKYDSGNQFYPVQNLSILCRNGMMHECNYIDVTGDCNECNYVDATIDCKRVGWVSTDIVWFHLTVVTF